MGTGPLGALVGARVKWIPRGSRNSRGQGKVSDFSAGVFQEHGRQPPATNLGTDCDLDQHGDAVNACIDGETRLGKVVLGFELSGSSRIRESSVGRSGGRHTPLVRSSKVHQRQSI